MNNQWVRSIPVGMRDYIYKDAQRRRGLEGELCNIFEGRGFREIITPTLEFYDVFCGEGAGVLPEDLYKTFDAKGRVLAFRHDMTTPIIRVAATKLSGANAPVRLYYCQSVLRQNKHLNGKYDEVAQCGAELLGVCSTRADIEILVTAMAAMRSAVGKDFKIEIGHAGYVQAAARAATPDREAAQALCRLVEKRAFADLDARLLGFDQDNVGVRTLRSLPSLFGGLMTLQRARDLSPNAEMKKILNEIEAVCEELLALGYEENISLDLGMGHQIAYYTGLIFRGYLEESSESCLNGGRYDALSGRFGREMPAVGFAINIDAILDAQTRSGVEFTETTYPDVVIHYDAGCLRRAAVLFDEMTQAGKACEMSVFEDLDESLSYARLAKTKEKLYYVHKRGTDVYEMEGSGE